MEIDALVTAVRELGRLVSRANAARRSNTPSGTSRDGRDTLSAEDAAAGHLGNGTALLAYNLTRVMNIMGIGPPIAAIRA
jgi:hypothetical protein